MRGAAALVVTILAALTTLFSGAAGSRLHAHVALTGPSGQTVPASGPAALAAELAADQRVIDDPASPALALQSAARRQQLVTAELAMGPVHVQRAVLARLHGQAARSLGGDLAAAAALARLNKPRRTLPPWKIISPPPPATLLGYFKSAQARYGVPWTYLAAIELIETEFGRVAGLSTAGAEGPMQFMPATWAAYGSGDVHDPRQAILAAARYLAANGAPADMPGAVYHYNLSRDYVAAVRDYATLMGSDPRAFYGYYLWQVILARVGGAVILPAGFPRVRPISLRAAEVSLGYPATAW